MGKPGKYFKRIILAVFGMLLIYICWFYLTSRGESALEFDAVMADKELYFVLGKEFKISDVEIYTGPSRSEKEWYTVMSDPLPGLRQIKYGQKFEGHSVLVPSAELQKNVKYMAKIDAPGYRGYVEFIIAADNKVIMTRNFDRKRPKNRTIAVERNDKIITVPYSVSFDKDGHKVITTVVGVVGDGS
ncbi:MAG: hypothetical protein HY796_04240 [Elusimicrobia bacterium]|nr:hypothetical protein [Elusimicrobiota bacterium]